MGATLYMFLNIMYLIVWKLESIGEKGKVWFNHMFLLVLKLLALLNNQLYFIVLSPTDFATFLFWKVAVPAALLQNGYREHGKSWLSSKMFVLQMIVPEANFLPLIFRSCWNADYADCRLQTADCADWVLFFFTCTLIF